MVKVRIAPSPTGFAHVGTAYTALFNWAFAKSKGGKFIVRVEDTDVKRNVKGAEEAIFDGLNWLGLSWDEGPFRQSERLDTYNKYSEKLIKEGKAYKDDGAIRFKLPKKDSYSWNDLVRGKIEFPASEVGDFVLMKTDGFPTYNFAVVIDDLLMKISHVIRGEEHISNTPRQLALYEALGEKPPLFAHLPTLRNKERKKLSKRRDPVDLRIYQEDGYLPEALVNFLCLLGWSHPEEKEIFDLKEFVENFDLGRVRKAGPIFDIEKLDWMNGEYIRKIDDEKLTKMIFDFYKGKYEKEKIKKTISLVKERINKLSEYESLAGFFFNAPKVDKKMLGRNYQEHLKEAIGAIEGGKDLGSVPKDNNFKVGDFFMDLRIAVTGKKVTPPINESIEILGKQETLKRLKRFIK